MDVGIVISMITAGGAFATATVGVVAAAVRGSKVDRRSLALQELEASLRHRAEDMASALERLKAMEERVDELDGQLEVAEKAKRTLRRENSELVDRVSALEQEVSQLEMDKEALQRDVEALRRGLRNLENGPQHD